MTLQGEVGELKSVGAEVRVSVINTKAKNAAQWRDYGPTLVFDVTPAASAAYRIGRIVKITVEPK